MGAALAPLLTTLAAPSFQGRGHVPVPPQRSRLHGAAAAGAQTCCRPAACIARRAGGTARICLRASTSCLGPAVGPGSATAGACRLGCAARPAQAHIVMNHVHKARWWAAIGVACPPGPMLAPCSRPSSPLPLAAPRRRSKHIVSRQPHKAPGSMAALAVSAGIAVACSQQRASSSGQRVAFRPFSRALAAKPLVQQQAAAPAAARRSVAVSAAAAAAPAQQKIRIKLKSYWVDLLADSVEKIREAASSTGATIAGPVPLPTRCVVPVAACCCGLCACRWDAGSALVPQACQGAQRHCRYRAGAV